jgi:calcium/calmodulin-dependent protein kinase I
VSLEGWCLCFLFQSIPDDVTAKIFIKTLLNPNPSLRPTASEAYDNHWLTTHKPGEDHDLIVGLRENFNAKAKWKSAITSARALHRFGSLAKYERVASTGSGKSGESGGWRGGWKDSDDEEDHGAPSGQKNGATATKRENGDDEESSGAPSGRNNGTTATERKNTDEEENSGGLSGQKNGTTATKGDEGNQHAMVTSPGKHPPKLPSRSPSTKREQRGVSEISGIYTGGPQKTPLTHAESDMIGNIPGSFNIPQRRGEYGGEISWSDLFRKMIFR